MISKMKLPYSKKFSDLIYSKFIDLFIYLLLLFFLKIFQDNLNDLKHIGQVQKNYHSFL